MNIYFQYQKTRSSGNNWLEDIQDFIIQIPNVYSGHESYNKV